MTKERQRVVSFSDINASQQNPIYITSPFSELNVMYKARRLVWRECTSHLIRRTVESSPRRGVERAQEKHRLAAATNPRYRKKATVSRRVRCHVALFAVAAPHL
jgi:hypothetical protein